MSLGREALLLYYNKEPRFQVLGSVRGCHRAALQSVPLSMGKYLGHFRSLKGSLETSEMLSS